MRWVWLMLAVAVGCGRFRFWSHPLDAPGDDGTDGGTVGCWQAWKDGTIDLSPPRPVSELANAANQSNPALSADGLTLYFDRGNDLYVATRTARGAPWQDATQLTELDSPQTERKMTVSGDGLLAIWTTNRSGSLALWTATRMRTSDPFSQLTMTPVVQLNASGVGGLYDPELTADGLRIYFSPGSGGGVQRIAFSTRSDRSQPFGTPTDLPELAVDASQQDPAVSPDELVILFSSSAANSTNNVLYYAVRDDRSQPFSRITQVAALNLANTDDGDIETSRDGCEVLFMSDRSGKQDLYTSLAR